MTLREFMDTLPTRAAKRLRTRRLRSQVRAEWPEDTPLVLWAAFTHPVHLLVLDGFGRGSLRIVEEALSRHGLVLGEGDWP